MSRHWPFSRSLISGGRHEARHVQDLDACRRGGRLGVGCGGGGHAPNASEVTTLGEDGPAGQSGILTAAPGYDDVTGLGSPTPCFVTALARD